MRLSHHPAMIIFPVLLLGVSFLSTWISLLPEGPGTLCFCFGNSCNGHYACLSL